MTLPAILAPGLPDLALDLEALVAHAAGLAEDARSPNGPDGVV